MIWRNIIKKLFIASLPLLIIPGIFLFLIIHYFGITTDSLLVIIMLAQAYIIWTQVEVALRQTHLSLLEYEPEFKIEVNKELRPMTEISDIQTFFDLRLVNTGKHLARNVLVSIDVRGERKEHKFMQFTNIAPNEPVDLYEFIEDLFNKNTLIVNIDYENVLGKPSVITFRKEPEFQEFIVTRHMRMPGILLTSFEDLMLIFRLFTLKTRVKR